MSAMQRYTMATDETFQARVRAQLFKGTVVVLLAGVPTYTALQVAAAKRVLNGLIPIEAFCLTLCNDATFGPLVDAAANEAALTDAQIMTGCTATVSVFGKGQI